ncbi:MAG: hypothetical protein MMC33_004071 [Icmadophila ericetorum]|nr:hypothetical protein [Icmadophila ericetorum]
MPSIRTLFAVGAALLTTTNAHMTLKSPVPYGLSTLNNSPLNGDGSDFPCKQRTGVYDAEGANNVMPIGVNQTLSFTGSAVHGGGSCQVSLTTDLAPTPQTQWQVIYSIIGGCPSNVPGNLPDDANGDGASVFQFSVPEGITPGKYTLAWTWFNKIGNREIYMNCAPVTVTSGSSKRDVAEVGFSKRSTFPPMYLANMGNECTTQDSTDLIFPDPGQYLQYAGTQGSPKASATGPGCAAQLVAGTGSAAASQSTPATTPSATLSPTATAAAESTTTATTADVGGIFGQSAASTMSTVIATPITTPIATITALPSIGTAAPSAAPSASGNGSGVVAAGSTSCPTPGQEVCSSDGTQIGMCDETGNVVLQPVAAGTKCQDGMMVFAKQKRSSRYRFGHVRRSHAGF